MRVYVAGAYADKARVQRMMSAVTDHKALVLAHNWVAVIDREKPEWDLSPAKRREYAEADLSHIREADLFWFLCPSSGHGKGCWVELGYAHAINKLIVGSGRLEQSIFTELCELSFLHDLDAFEFIAKTGGRQLALKAV